MHIEQYRAWGRANYQRNKETILFYHKQYYERNRDKILEARRNRYVPTPRNSEVCQCGFSSSKKDMKLHKQLVHSY
jgi:hypothetical protein